MKEFWKRKNVFVTGCSGFLGRNLVRELVNQGANVIGLVRNSTLEPRFQQEVNDKKVKIVEGTLENVNVLERVLKEYKIDTVFHLAAQPIVSKAIQEPIETFRSNILGTWNVLEPCRNSSVKKIIITSSEKSYGHPTRLPLDETMPLQGRQPYDVSKSCADLIAQTYYYTYKLPVCITRFGNVYGGGDLNFNRIIPQTIHSIIHHESPIIRSDGTFVRDYFHVEDAVHAMMLLAEKMEELGIWGEAFNFSNENPLSVYDVVTKILTVMNSDLHPIIQKLDNHETKQQFLSAKKAKEVLGWKPIFHFDTGLKRTIEWYEEYFSRLGEQN